MEPRYFEDIKIGDVYITLTRTITETDLVNFVALSNFYEILFMDADYALNKSIFKKRLIPGPLTYSIAEGLTIQTGWNQGTGMGLLEVDRMRHPVAVAVGDTIHTEMEFLEKRETNRPDRGVVLTHHRVKNQRDELVMEYTITRFLRRRQAK